MIRIASKGRDIFPHPAQRGQLIQQAVVAAGARLSDQIGVAEEAQKSQPVIEGNEDHAPFGVGLAGEGDLLPAAVAECATVDPDRYRQLFGIALSRGPDVQHQ